MGYQRGYHLVTTFAAKVSWTDGEKSAGWKTKLRPANFRYSGRNLRIYEPHRNRTYNLMIKSHTSGLRLLQGLNPRVPTR